MGSDSNQNGGQAAQDTTANLQADASVLASRLDKRSPGRHERLPLAVLLATGFGIGYSPVAPGTLGAALGVGIYGALLPLGALNITVLLVSVALFVAGTYLSFMGEHYFKEKDCQKIVIDEVASFPLTMLFISPTPLRIAVAFALNRAADILKPFPAGRIQRLKGGWGVMLDDTVAAIYANLLLRLLILLFKV